MQGLPAEWLETEQAEAALRVVCLRVVLTADPTMRADLQAQAVELLLKDLLDGRRRVRKLLPEDGPASALWAKDAPLLDGLVETEVGLDPTATRWSKSRARSAELWRIRCAVPELRAAALDLAAQTVRWAVDRDTLVRVAVGRRLALLPEAHQLGAEGASAGEVLSAGYLPAQGDRVTLAAQTEAMLPRLQLVTAGMLLRDTETLRGLSAEDRAALEQPLAEVTAEVSALEQAAKAAGQEADAGNPAAWGKGSRWVKWATLRWEALAAEWAALCKWGHGVMLEGPQSALLRTARLAPTVLQNRPQDLWEVRVQPAGGGAAVAVAEVTLERIAALQEDLQVPELLPLVWWLARTGAARGGAPWWTRTLTEVETGCGTRRNASGAKIVEAARALSQLVVNLTVDLPDAPLSLRDGRFCTITEVTAGKGQGRSQVLEWSAGSMLRVHNLAGLALGSDDFRNRGFRSIALPEAPAPIASNRHTQQERMLQGEVLAELSRRSPEYAAQKGLPLTVQEWKTLLDRAGLAWANGKTKDRVLEAWTQNRAQQTGGQLVLPLPGQGPFLDGDALESGLVRLSEVTHSGTHRWLLDGGEQRAVQAAAAKTQAGKPRKRKTSRGAK
jgi:hypothetical protein